MLSTIILIGCLFGVLQKYRHHKHQRQKLLQQLKLQSHLLSALLAVRRSQRRLNYCLLHHFGDQVPVSFFLSHLTQFLLTIHILCFNTFVFRQNLALKIAEAQTISPKL